MIIERIAKETGVSVAVLRVIIETASHRYKTYTIAKRTGGVREINHPAPAVKFLQRWVVQNFIGHLPVHPSVMSYKRGVGIVENARIHVAQNYLLKMDFQNFFPSIKGEDVRNLIATNMTNLPFAALDANDLDIIVKIVCRKNQLTIGAPSSPTISNAVLYKFDEFISIESERRGIIYSRYADDISFSTDQPNALSEILEIVKKTLIEQAWPRLTINFDKTVFASKKRRRVVTGLVLSSDEKVSIGRDKKREIKALCHRFKKGDLAAPEVSYLRGYLSFVNSVEPTFIESLRKKYGAAVLEEIITSVPVQRK